MSKTIIRFRAPHRGVDVPAGYLAATIRVGNGPTLHDFQNYACGGTPEPGEDDRRFKERLVRELFSYLLGEAIAELDREAPREEALLNQGVQK